MAIPWMQAVTSVKAAIAAQKPGYSQSNYITISVDNHNIKVRTDCSGYVSACLNAYGVLSTILSSRNFASQTDASMASTGFTPMAWPGWDQLITGDIIAIDGHVEIFSRNVAGTHYVYNCGSNESTNDPGETKTGHSSYTTVWRVGNALPHTGGNIEIMTTLGPTVDWGVAQASITDNDPSLTMFKRTDLEITEDMYAGSDVLRDLKDKMVDAGAGYLIYFDNHLMNRYVTNFSCTCSNDGRINNASIELLYAPSFWKTEIRDTKANLYQSLNGIDNGTNVRIFIMNIVTRKFDIVFDGIVKGKARNKTAYGVSLSVSAVNQLDWLNRISVPVSIPLNQNISTGDKIKWLGQGIDVGAIDSIVFARETSFKGKTVVEYVSELIEKTFRNNWLFKDTNTAGNFDDAQGRICIMGDINEELRKAQCIDFVVSSSTEIVDKMYVMLNEVAQRLLIEFYADRDGSIRIKPPFWNQPVLKDHVIDPMFIISESEYTDYNSFFTRIISTGGQEEYQTNIENAPDWLTPVGCYVGNMTDPEKAFWADFTGVQSQWQQLITTSGQTGGTPTEANQTGTSPVPFVGPMPENQQSTPQTPQQAFNISQAPWNQPTTQTNNTLPNVFSIQAPWELMEQGIWLRTDNKDKSIASSSRLALKNATRNITYAPYKKFKIKNDFKDVTQDRNGVKYLHAGIDFEPGNSVQIPYFGANGDNMYAKYWKGPARSKATGSDSKTLDSDHDKCYNLEIYYVSPAGPLVVYQFFHLLEISDTIKQASKKKQSFSLSRGDIVGKSAPGIEWHIGVCYNDKFYDPMDSLGAITAAYPWEGAQVTPMLNPDGTLKDEFKSDEQKKIEKEGADAAAKEPQVKIEEEQKNPDDVTAADFDYSYFSTLLKPSDDERKYGPSIYETMQPMIKFSTSTAVEDAKSPALALRLYSQFLYYMLNSNLDTNEVTTIAMPWLRPGFNIWMNPADSDKVYYLNAITFSGNPKEGCTSQLSLSLGRERYTFTTNQDYFGSQKDKCDNLLISELFDSQKVDKFGAILNDNSEYENIREGIFDFYNSEEAIAAAEYSKHLQELYGSVNHSPEIKTLANISNETENTEYSLTGKCNKADAPLTEINNFNDEVSPEKRFIYMPFDDNMNKIIISNGYSEGVHNGIDIYCQDETKIYSPCSGELREVKKTARGYAVKMYTYKTDKSACLYVYVAHITTLEPKFAKYVGRKVSERTAPSVSSGEQIGTCQGELHLAAELTDYEHKTIKPVNVLDYMRKKTSLDIVFDSSKYDENNENTKQSSTVQYEEGEENSFSSSKKFFKREMSYDEIDSQISQLYEEAPAVIRNRCEALSKRIEEAERFMQRFYHMEEPPIWQDPQKIKDYASDRGYLYNEWIDNMYEGDTPEDITVNIGSFSKRTTTAIYGQTDQAIIGQEGEVEIPKFPSYCFTHEWTLPRKDHKWITWSSSSNQRKLYEKWSQNPDNDRGIATMNGRYLVAVRPAIGATGQYIDAVCTDRNGAQFIIPCIVFDIKGADRDNNIYGHLYLEGKSLNVLEFHYITSLYGTSPKNPGTPEFFPEWQLGSVDKIIKYDKNVLDWR